MSALTSGPLGYLGRQVVAWREAHGWAPGLVWDAKAHGPGRKPRCEHCNKPAHGAYVKPQDVTP